mmetsp:Transcript_36254/g.58039  ORF Transcript_36254/g.58039 Transcript_36254/m.58039 type:complete len:177 (-) Transcript_36254:1208-1738(-)
MCDSPVVNGSNARGRPCGDRLGGLLDIVRSENWGAVRQPQRSIDRCNNGVSKLTKRSSLPGNKVGPGFDKRDKLADTIDVYMTTRDMLRGIVFAHAMNLHSIKDTDSEACSQGIHDNAEIDGVGCSSKGTFDCWHHTLSKQHFEERRHMGPYLDNKRPQKADEGETLLDEHVESSG